MRKALARGELRYLGERHLDRTAAGHKPRVDHDVARHIHGVLEIALDLVEDVLAGAAQYDRARLGILTVDDEREITETTPLNVCIYALQQ